MDTIKEPTQQGLAMEFAKMGIPVIPCKQDKTPIIDSELCLIHWNQDATTDMRMIAKIWHKYQNAAIGLVLPSGLIVIDCDVLKDGKKVPILRNGIPIQIGIESLQQIMLELNLSKEDLNTLSWDTQSGGRQFLFMMPPGFSSFNHTRLLDGLDVKGFGGYVIAPNSIGKFGQYKFRNLTEIKEIPIPLLNYINAKTKQCSIVNLSSIKGPGRVKIDCDTQVEILTPYWSKADGRRNDFMLAIAGFIARSGGAESDASYIVSKLSKITGKGGDHVNGVRYTFERTGKLKGIPSLRKIMEEIRK